MAQGVFIVIEGTDGSGKGTQFEKLITKLRADKYEIATFDFPQYGQPSAYFVEQYLNGNYGSLEDIGPYKGSLFYALDRYEASFKIREAIDSGKIVLCNRYVGSNMAHQGSKLEDSAEREKYFEWLDNVEFEILGIPRPDLNLVLHVPAEIAQKLVDEKAKRAYIQGTGKRDIHEANLGHLQKSELVYKQICGLFPEHFLEIECVRDGELLGIEAVFELVWNKVAAVIKVVK